MGASKRRWAQNTPIIISRNRVKGDNSSKAGHLGRDRNECTLKTEHAARRFRRRHFINTVVKAGSWLIASALNFPRQLN